MAYPKSGPLITLLFFLLAFLAVLGVDAYLFVRRQHSVEVVGDGAVLVWFEVAEGEVFEFPFQLPDAESIGQWRIDFAGLEGNGFAAAILSGDVPQKKRLSLLKRFSSGEVSVLVATDVAARGLHIEEVKHVIN